MNAPVPTPLQFPSEFIVGAATAAYQVEGAVGEDGRTPSVWDTFAHTPGRIYRGDTGDIACDHFHRFESDLDSAAELGLRAFRFSLSWTRILPDGVGRVEPRGIDHYRRVAAACRERGIRPFVALYHWDLPQVLQDAGGWAERETAHAFAAFARVAAEGLGDLVEDWITMIEPGVASLLGYGSGEHAPGIHDGRSALRAGHHLLLAHGLAVPALRQAAPGSRVGLALNHWPVIPATDSAEDQRAARMLDGYSNRMFFDPVLAGTYPQDMLEHYGADIIDAVQPGDLDVIAAPLDFLGINYYSTSVAASAEVDPGERWPRLGARAVERSDGFVDAMGWMCNPKGLADLLRILPAVYPKCPPLMVTENGTALNDYRDPTGQVHDTERIAYLDAHLRAVHAARADGVNVIGYMVWSLLDNFEWALGYSKRFGLIHVDYATQTRTLKESAHWLRDALAGGMLQLPSTSSSAPSSVG